MNDSGQLPMTFSAEWRAKKAWEDLLQTFNRTAQYVGHKQLAAELDTSPSNLSHALAERERRFIRGEWFPGLVMLAPDDAAIEILADLRGKELAPRRRLTPAEKLAAYRARVRSFSPELAAALEKEIGE